MQASTVVAILLQRLSLVLIQLYDSTLFSAITFIAQLCFLRHLQYLLAVVLLHQK